MPLCASRAPVSAPEGYGWHCTVAAGPDHDGSFAPVMMTGSTSRAAVGCAWDAGGVAISVAAAAAMATILAAEIPIVRVLRFALGERRANENERTSDAGAATIASCRERGSKNAGGRRREVGRCGPRRPGSAAAETAQDAE